MGGMGMFLGGVAQGFGAGVKDVKDLEDEKLEQEKRQRERDAQAISDKIGTYQKGDIVPVDVNGGTVADAAQASAQPGPNVLQRMGHTVMSALRPQDAAVASGVAPTTGVPGQPPPPASASDVNAVAGLPADPSTVAAAGPPPGPAAGMPASATGAAPAPAPAAGATPLTGGAGADTITAPQDGSTPVDPGATVTGRKQPTTRAWTEADDALMALRVAGLRGGDVSGALANYNTAVQRGYSQEIQLMTNPDQLSNVLSKTSGHNVVTEPVLDPDTGKPVPDQYTVSIDGKDSGQGPMSFQQLKDNAIGVITNNPEYAQKANLERVQSAQRQQEINNTHQYQQGALALEGQKVRNEAELNHIRAQQIKGEAGINLERARALKAENDDIQSYGDMTSDTGGKGDAFLNQGDLTTTANRMYARNPGAYGGTIMGQDGMQHPYNKLAADTQGIIQGQQQAYENSPYTKGGVLSVKTLTNKQTGETRNAYALKAADGTYSYYSNLHAAEIAGRQAYPKMENLQTPAQQVQGGARGRPVTHQNAQ